MVYRLKSVGDLKMKFVAPMPEQIKTPTMHFPEVSRDPSYLSIGILRDIEKCQFSPVRPTFMM